MKQLYFTAIAIAIGLSSLAQNISFPDNALKTALLSTNCTEFGGSNYEPAPNADVDTNNDGEISLEEAAAVTNLTLTEQNIALAGGLEFFTNLQYLDISGNILTTLNVSMMTNLITFYCNDNQLNQLTLNQNGDTTLLNSLFCSNNQLSQLTLLANRYDIVNCSSNNLSAIDFTNSLSVYEAHFNNNNLSSFSLLPTAQINILDLSGNPLTIFNPSLAQMESLSISNTLLTSLDLSLIQCGTGLYVMDNLNLQYINLQNNSFDGFGQSLFLSGNTLLQSVCIDDISYTDPEGVFLSEFQYVTAAINNSNVFVIEDCALKSQSFTSSNVSIYPNPVETDLNIVSEVNVIAVVVYNMLGQIVLQPELQSTSSVDVSQLKTGTYIIQIKTADAIKTQKFLKL